VIIIYVWLKLRLNLKFIKKIYFQDVLLKNADEIKTIIPQEMLHKLMTFGFIKLVWCWLIYFADLLCLIYCCQLETTLNLGFIKKKKNILFQFNVRTNWFFWNTRERKLEKFLIYIVVKLILTLCSVCAVSARSLFSCDPTKRGRKLLHWLYLYFSYFYSMF
jgi:hypothetical protein